MKKYLQIIIAVAVSVLAVYLIAYAANTYPTTLNDWGDGDIIESEWANQLEAKIGVTGSLVTSSLDYRVSNLASLSQDETVTGTWTFSTNPTFASGKLVSSNSLDFDEFVNSMTLDANTTITNSGYAFTIGAASVSTNFEVGGYASASKLYVDNLILDGNKLEIGNNLGALTIEADNNIFIQNDFGYIYLAPSGASVSTNFEVNGGYASASVFYAGDGSVSLPAYTFGNDKNTGLYSSGADDLAFSAGGLNFLNFINTAQDVIRFNVAGNDIDFEVWDNSSNLAIFADAATHDVNINNGDVLFYGDENLLDVTGAASVSSNFEVGGYASISANNGLLVTSNGTPSPKQAIHIYTPSATVARFAVQSSGTYMSFGADTGGGPFYMWNNTQSLRFADSNDTNGSGFTERFRIGAAGGSTSYNFEAVGYASTSQYFGKFASISNGLEIGTVAVGGKPLNIQADTSDFLARFEENSGGEYMDLQIDSSGDLSFFADSGSIRLKIQDLSQAINVVTLEGMDATTGAVDANTEISFSDDQIAFTVGGVTAMTITEAGTDTITFGSYVIDAGSALSFEIPNASGGSAIDAAGEVTVDTASQSFNYYTSAERVLGPFDKCFAVSIDGTDLSANSIFAVWTADEPYTLAMVSMKASGSNSATWKLLSGATTPTTTMITKQASGSAQKKYTSFTSSAIPDGDTVYAQVSSKSATLDDVLIRACLYKDP